MISDLQRKPAEGWSEQPDRFLRLLNNTTQRSAGGEITPFTAAHCVSKAIEALEKMQRNTPSIIAHKPMLQTAVPAGFARIFERLR
jgi:hypothetical protein